MRDRSDSVDDCSSVLLVGAAPRDARIAACGLEREGVSMDGAADVRAAIDRLARGSEDRTNVDLPDLLAIDLTATPEVSLTVLGAVRSSPRLHTLPVVAIVEQTPPASELRTRVRQACGHGVNGYVAKPDDVEAYADAMQQMATFWFGRVTLPPESLCSASTSIQYD